jgi:16S rRNA (guanine966-N2)-methyltransferase
VRIISGIHKGRRLSPPKNLPVRPTTDMCKEAIFSVLNNYFNFSEIVVLDLFSGTGSISFEFASRGTQQIVSVDADFGCVKFIKQTTHDFNFPITVLKSDVFKFLEKNSNKFDVIFADPPYELELHNFEKTVRLVTHNEMLTDEGMLVIEHSKHTNLDHVNYFLFRKNYGGSVFSFFGFKTENENKTE